MRIVITGSTNGIGQAAARALAPDHDLILLGRDPARLDAMAKETGAETYVADFEDLASVRAAAAAIRKRHRRLDVLLNNAGGYWPKRRITADGHERTFQVDQLAPFLLTQLLLPALDHKGGRIVNVASEAHQGGHLDFDDLELRRRRYGGYKAYKNAKMANVAWTFALARRLKKATTDCLHPGVVQTRIFDNIPGWAQPVARLFLRRAIPPEEGADTAVWLCTHTPDDTPGYYARRRRRDPHPDTLDPSVQERLWNACSAVC